MRRRFGRGRRQTESGEGKAASIDAGAWLRRVVEAGFTGATALEPMSREDVPVGFAVLGSGARSAGGRALVALSPRSGSHALLAALALASRREPGVEAPLLFAVSPRWPSAARQLLGLVRTQAVALRAFELAEDEEARGRVEPEPLSLVGAIAPREIADRIIDGEQRDVFVRAAAALDGLAAKHGGAVRCAGETLELVLLARRVAVLSVQGGRTELETRMPSRHSQRLAAEDLATALDRLEGSLRKILSDKKIRGSEEGLRALLLPLLERSLAGRWQVRWPLFSGESEVVDLAAVGADGTPRVAAARERIGLAELAAILEAAFGLGPAIAAGAAREGVRVRPCAPEIVLAARQFDAAALAALELLTCGRRLYDVQSARSGALSLESRAALPAAETLRRPPAAPIAEAPPRAERPSLDTPEPERRPARFEEVSLFDLDDEARASGESEGAPARRRRARGRRRGGRGRAAGERGPERTADEAEPRGGEPRSEPRERAPARRARADSAEIEVPEEEMLREAEEEDTLVPLAADAPELEEVEEPAYEDEEEAEEIGADVDREHRERELRRRARIAKSAPKVEVAPPPHVPRRRAAFVAHADRVSLLSAVLLARDVRLVEGFWVYPQDDLMTFFRSVATDLREETPIFMVGFMASPPARDTLQAASLYRGRLSWFDHHEWPPEDLQSLRAAIGEENVYVQSGSDSSLSAILGQRTRRSRFSDKLAELIAARFTQHDYERWGRVWWQRAGEIAAQPGERRAEIEPLLVGRPSDLARAAAQLPVPPPPPELAHVAERDFRLVHFGGFTMVVAIVPRELDLHLTARIARERYEAQLSLAAQEGSELVVLGGDESRTRRGLDLGGMVDHLAAKHAWIDAMADADQVARMRVRQLWQEPGRLDEVICEIAMGRSIVEG
ncbi:MAG: hypothetical protein OEM49_02245 [Myxococcales bacterium]|nr:hypothetical protein [Myxococcales bacterium]